MTATTRRRTVNPLLGTYFGIFASCIAAIGLLLLMFEQLGISDDILRQILVGTMLMMFAAIGGLARTSSPTEFFAAGHRVPAVFAGLGVAVSLTGGVGLLVVPGLLYLIGFDALFLTAGMTAGLVVLAILIAPYVRKFGAPTLPSFFALRFDSTALRVVAAGIIAIPLLLLIVAEMKIAAQLTGWLLQRSDIAAALLVATALALTLVPGGARSSSWSGAAQAVAMLGILVVPVTIVAIIETNLPFPQLSHGVVMRAVARLEAIQQIPMPSAELMQFAVPGPEAAGIARRYANPFVNVGPLAFVFAALAIMAGVAGHPALLSRTGTTPSVYETRKSIGWAIFLISVGFLSLSAVGVFLREAVLTQLVGQPPGAMPAWFSRLRELGLATLDGSPERTTAASVLVRRDAALLALPVTAGLPAAIVYLGAAAGIAAALAAAGASITALATILSEDVLNGPHSELVGDRQRLLVARTALLAVLVTGGWMAILVPGDPLELLLWAMAIIGSTTFPVLLLSVWWKRGTRWGAMAGLVSGCVVAMMALLAGELAGIGLPGPMAAIVGAPVAIAVMLVVSRIGSGPERHVLELVRDLRVPGGETLYDRDVRLRLARQRRQVAS